MSVLLMEPFEFQTLIFTSTFAHVYKVFENSYDLGYV